MKNAEGYPDPTAGKAIHRADKQPDNVELAIRSKLWPENVMWKSLVG